jgi:hypothetical protein
MTGIDTKLAIELVKSRSYPKFVPSLSIDVRSISPAPFFSTIFAYSIASIPVAFLPPWVKISHLLAPTFFASIAMTIHCDPNLIELSFIKL